MPPLDTLGPLLEVLLWVLAGLGVITALVFVLSRVLVGGAVRHREELRAVAGPSFLETTTPQLLDWDLRRVVVDLSSEVERTGVRGATRGGWVHAHGTVPSLRDGSEAWLAFVVDGEGDEGEVALRSSEAEVRIQVGREEAEVRVRHRNPGAATGASPSHASGGEAAGDAGPAVEPASYAGATSIGRVRLTGGHRIGRELYVRDILDPDGEQIGQLRPQPIYAPGGSSKSWDLWLGGHPVCRISYLSDAGDRPFRAPSLIQEVPSLPEPDEERWILAAVGLSLWEHVRAPRRKR